MQSLYGRIRSVTMHHNFGLKSSSVFASDGVAAISFLSDSIDKSAGYLSRMVLQKTFGTQTGSLISSDRSGMPSAAVFQGYSRQGVSQCSLVVPTFVTRCLTTLGDSGKSITQDPSASISDILDKEAVEDVRAKREIPDIKPGYIIQFRLEVPENKRRSSVLKGIVIARRNAGLNTTIRIRRLVAGVGIENLLPLYSPNIKEIKVLDKKKVRRAKLYYLRDKLNPFRGKWNDALGLVVGLDLGDEKFCFNMHYLSTDRPETMSLRPKERTEVRQNRYKVVVDAEEGRRQREDNMVEIRKNRREESLQKKRCEGL
ncbi:hypothetical protein RJ639_030316 [Escallonia herrerae]|uniref:IBB domain-containing protein n=1 Tax=Escallonia herrerae TaxID=1293975 RepID=A0AA88X5X5_9ASTE|nr:hypothetical protein RJ639_030316 [Escallonia herrerae]